MQQKDVLFVGVSDMHSGGSTALCLNRLWQGKHNNHTPTRQQREMYAHFETCIAEVRAARKGKRVVLVHNGDAIDGVHHHSPQAITLLKDEQIEIHTELMDVFMRGIGWAGGDLLYYTYGTECHVGDKEERCAADLGAVENRDGGMSSIGYP